MEKIFIIYANSGSGHRRAAEALHSAAKEYFSEAEVKLFDSLDYMTPVFKRSYPSIYLFLVNYLPRLWGLCYYFLDFNWVDRVVRIFRRITNTRNGQRFIQFIMEEKPDLIISTHFMPNEIISGMKKRYGFRIFLATCVTDYYPHAFWRDQGVDLYITPNEESVPRLIKLGIPASNIRTVGIPIDPLFEKADDKRKIRASLGLREDMFTVLVSSGGFGVGPVEELVSSFKKIPLPLQIVVICGNNSKLQDDLGAITQGTIHNFKIYGFVHNMHEIMDASDLMISKAGGLTSSEALAKSLPLIVVNPIPGQESNNCDFLIRHGCCLKANNTGQVIRMTQKLVENPEEIIALRRNMSALGRPRAAREVISMMRNILDRGGFQ